MPTTRQRSSNGSKWTYGSVYLGMNAMTGDDGREAGRAAKDGERPEKPFAVAGSGSTYIRARLA